MLTFITSSVLIYSNAHSYDHPTDFILYRSTIGTLASPGFGGSGVEGYLIELIHQIHAAENSLTDMWLLFSKTKH